MIDELYETISQRVGADCGLHPGPLRRWYARDTRLFIVAADMSLPDVCRAMNLDRFYSVADLDTATYFWGVKAMVVKESQHSDKLRFSCAYVLCLFLFDGLCDNRSYYHWAVKGYARFLSNQVIWPEWTPGRNELGKVVQAKAEGCLWSLWEMLAVDAPVEECFGPSGVNEQAYCFVSYLSALRCETEAPWEQLGRIIRKRIAAGPKCVQAFEKAFDQPIGRIEEGFLTWCNEAYKQAGGTDAGHTTPPE